MLSGRDAGVAHAHERLVGLIVGEHHDDVGLGQRRNRDGLALPPNREQTDHHETNDHPPHAPPAFIAAESDERVPTVTITTRRSKPRRHTPALRSVRLTFRPIGEDRLPEVTRSSRLVGSRRGVLTRTRRFRAGRTGRPGARRLDERTPQKPAWERLHETGRTAEPDGFGGDGAGPPLVPLEHQGERRCRRGHDHVGVEAGMLEAHRRFASVEHHPDALGFGAV